MIYPKKLIWQPAYIYQPHSSFDIFLDRDFAREMVELILPPEAQLRMNELGAEITKSYKYSSPSPYRFHENTAFVREINLLSGGKWLALEGHSGNSPDFSKKEPLVYTTHNLDCRTDRNALLELFDKWVFFSDTLKSLYQ